MSRQLTIDTLRGFACILLVAYHVVGGDPSSGLRLAGDHGLQRTNEMLGLLRMPLFSFLSGFVYAWRPYQGAPAQFVKGKARRLLMPMLVVGTFYALLQAYTPGTNGGQPDWALLHVIPVAHFWFLEALFWIFLLIAGLEHFALLSTSRRFALAWLGAAALFVGNPLPVHLGLYGAGYLLPFFMLGLACNRFGAKVSRRAVLLGSLGLLMALVAYQALSASTLPEKIGVVALLISCSCCVLVLQLGWEWRWLAWIGAQSFPIYLFHSMFSAASRIALQGAGAESTLLLFVAGVAMSFGGAILLAKLLRQVPGGHWVLGESSRPRPSLAGGGGLLRPPG